ncbi:MAG: hypothetical protein ACRDN9_19900 [Streptosporangiaceae bacterium]
MYLHIGAPKSGTTFVQDVLWHNRDALARDGVLYPADSPDDHFHAALDLRRTRFRGYDDPAVPGTWQRVADRARNWRGPVAVISHELLAWANEDQARRAVESLAPAEVHIVYTARDLVRQIPAMWQEAIKNGRVVRFPRYLRSLARPERRGPFARIFWGSQDAADVLRRWGAAIPADRVHLVTVPGPGAPPGQLWERFASAVRLDPAKYDIQMGGSNVSLGVAEVELLRRVNTLVREALEWPVYAEVVKRGFAERTLASRAGKIPITLPPAWHTWVAKRSTELVEALRDEEYDIVGDLEDLLPEPEPEPGPADSPGPGPAGADAVRDVAVETLASVLMDTASARSAPRAAWRRRVRVTRRRAQGMLRRLGTRGHVISRG